MIAERAFQALGMRALIQGQQLLAARLCQTVPHLCSYGTSLLHSPPIDLATRAQDTEDIARLASEPLDFFDDPPEKDAHLPPVVLAYRRADQSKHVQPNEALLGSVVRRRLTLKEIHAKMLQSAPAPSNKWRTGYSPIEAERALSKHEVQVGWPMFAVTGNHLSRLELLACKWTGQINRPGSLCLQHFCGGCN